MNYKEVNTKKEYNNLLNELSIESKILTDKYPEISIYKSIHNQIDDIQNMIHNNIKLSENDLSKKYSIGAIAVKNFDCEKDIFGRKLQDLFGALFEYCNMPES